MYYGHIELVHDNMEENYFVALRVKTGNELELMFYAWYTYNMRVQFPIVMETYSRQQLALQEEMRMYWIQQLKRRVKDGIKGGPFVSYSSFFGMRNEVGSDQHTINWNFTKSG